MLLPPAIGLHARTHARTRMQHARQVRVAAHGQTRCNHRYYYLGSWSTHTQCLDAYQCWQWAAGGSTIDSSSRVACARVAFVDQLANAVKPVTISAVPKRILRDQTELAVDPRPTREVFVGTRCEK